MNRTGQNGDFYFGNYSKNNEYGKKKSSRPAGITVIHHVRIKLARKKIIIAIFYMIIAK